MLKPLRSTALMLFGGILLTGCAAAQSVKDTKPQKSVSSIVKDVEDAKDDKLVPMAIQSLREREYPGGDFVFEERLGNGSNYEQYIASYQSEGLKIYGLLTVPTGAMPEGGYPAIIFVHGYIPPDQYSTTKSYPTYPLNFSRSGYVMFKPDLRGHGNSEGEPASAHYSEKYIVDTMNAIAHLKDYPKVNPEKIGYWGHSNGGEIGLRVVLISPDIKAASLWAGVVGSYEDMLETYNQEISFLRNAHQFELVIMHGLPSTNPEFWNTVDPYAFLDDINIPIQLQHGTNDESVPLVLTQHLNEELKALSKNVTYYEYQGDDHNIGNNSDLAFRRDMAFFDEYLK
jgi:dipeptidyl aminopeptidase/acylaminoacyl peptidase